MPFFIAALMGGFATAMGSLVGRVLLALGMSFVTYKGMTTGTDQIIQYLKEAYGGMPGEAGALLQFLWVDKALAMMVSSFGAAWAIRSLSGTITKLTVMKND